MSIARTVVGTLGEILITLGLLVFAFLAWQLWWTDVEADDAQAGSVAELERSFTRPGASPATERADPRLAGEAFAVLRVPRFGRDYARPIVEGTSHGVLDRGVGHYTGTAMPGQIGNFATAGHRVTYGKPYNRIAELRSGDRAVVETAWGWFVYRATGSKIVLPDHGQATAPVPERPGARPTVASMVMTACHPQFSARERFVEYLVLEARFPRTKGLPARYLQVVG